MEQRDFYEVLGTEREADQKEIRSAYRKLAFEYHPDKNRDNPDAAAKMKEINESYAALSDPEKRQRYDSLRQTYGSSANSQFRQAYSEQDIFRGSDIQQIFEELSKAFGLRGFDDIFKESYGTRYQTFEFKRPGGFGSVFMGGAKNEGVNAQSFPGGKHLLRLIRYGLKKKWGIELPEEGKDLNDLITISPELARDGGKIRYSCRKNVRELVVNIPSNIRAGQKIRLKGMGEEGKGGAKSGDLYVLVKIRNPWLQKTTDFFKRRAKEKS